MGNRLGPILDHLARRDLAERTAAFAAAASVGRTFAPSLLPRGAVDQAVATGLSASLSYGVASLTQSIIDNVAKKLAIGPQRAPGDSRKYLAAIANAAALVGGIGLQRAFSERRGEPLKRASVRTVGWELAFSGASGLLITGVTGAAAATSQRYGGRLHPAVVPSGFLLGACVSAAEITWFRRHQDDAPPLAKSLGEGLLVMTGVSVLAYGETQLARGVAKLVRKTAPGLSLLAEPIGHAAGLGLLAGVVGLGMEYVYRDAETGGSAIEAAYNEAPTALGVSGGPQSVVDWQTLSREGRRFVNMALTPQHIAQVTGKSAQLPIRAFVGLESAPTVDARVALTLEELEKLGAFERDVLCFISPTGTGYINYVAVETLEYLTAGHCATVAMQYSLRPSFMSLDRVALGREQNRALLHAINGRLLGIAPQRRPKLVVFGESLGAWSMQDAFLHEGTVGLHRMGIARGLFIGTPAESKWAEQWRCDPDRYDPHGEVVEVASYDEWCALDDDVRQRMRFVLLSHHEDPITKFSPALIVQAPVWLSDGPKRSPAAPKGVKWEPFTSFVMTAVDLKNASQVVPGTFAALGHDYRADLARFTDIAFALGGTDDEIASIENALRERELKWASRRLVAEQLAQAREAVSRQLKSWGASIDSVPALADISNNPDG